MEMPLVTIGIPVYKRLRFLPQAVQSVAAQDYQNIELIVSDNGVNGSAIPELVGQYYTRPYRFRQNPATINVTLHFNQIVQEATGDYVVLLGDDDEISPNFVSDLVGVVQRHPEIPVVISKQDFMDEEGRTFRTSSDNVPELLSGEEFIKAWCRGTYGWLTFSTVLMKTSEVRHCGGFVVIPTGNGDENALMIKMALDHSIGVSARSMVRKRQYPTSLGYSCSYPELTNAARHFIRFLDTDDTLRDYAKRNTGQWSELRGLVVDSFWKMCYGRWMDLYRGRLSTLQWVAVSLTMPWIPAYYRTVARTLLQELKFAVLTSLKDRFPWIKKLFQVFRKMRLDHQ